MQKVLEYIKHVEGDKVHRNKGEKDITSPYGIYKHAHPDASIFNYIDSVANSLSIVKNSKKWTAEDILTINKNLDTAEIDEHALAFYEEYFKGARLHLFDKNAKILCAVLYSNSTVMMWKSVQTALLTLQKQERIDGSLELSIADGLFGRKTDRSLSSRSVQALQPYELYDNIMIAAQYNYVSLWHKNKIKYGVFLFGWLNRLKKILG